jgi:hypothetical protein
MNLGEILDRTFQIYRARFLAFVGIAALPALAILVIQLAYACWPDAYRITHPSQDLVIILLRYLARLVIYHFSSFFQLLVFPAYINQISSTFLGSPRSIATSLRFAAARWRSYLWVAVLKMSLQFLIPEFLTAGLCIGAVLIADKAGTLKGSSSPAALIIVAFAILAGIVIFIWFGVCLSLAMPVSALENLVGREALRRSWKLTRDSRARIVAVWILMTIFAWVFMVGVQLAVQWTTFYLVRGAHIGVRGGQVYVIEGYVSYGLMYALLGPIFPIALTLFYYDQRIRREGYDIERMMDAAGMNAPLSAPLIDEQAPHAGPAEVQP